MREALALALQTIRGVVSGAESLTIAELIAIRDRVAAEMGGGASMEEIRSTAFERTLAEFGGDSALAARITEQYLADRFRLTHPYEDVVSTLDVLRDDYTLGLATNGNSYPDRIGLSGYFNFVVFAHECGFRKPDPRFFDAIVRDARCAADQITFVGDSLTEDIEPAVSAGFRAVWINRDGRRPSEPVEAIEIGSLRELPALL